MLGVLPARSGWAAEGPAGTQDGVLVEAAGIPGQGTLRVTAALGAGGTSPSGGAVTTAGMGLQWAVSPSLQLRAGAAWDRTGFAPAASLGWQVLSARSGPLDALVALELRALGWEGTGSELGVQLAVGQRFGPMSWMANLMVGQGLGPRSDVDLEGAVGAWVALGDRLRAGAEAQMRTELVDTFETSEDFGRPFELSAGPAAALELGPLELRALIGWRVPRGQLPPGAFGRLIVGYDF